MLARTARLSQPFLKMRCTLSSECAGLRSFACKQDDKGKGEDSKGVVSGLGGAAAEGTGGSAATGEGADETTQGSSSDTAAEFSSSGEVGDAGDDGEGSQWAASSVGEAAKDSREAAGEPESGGGRGWNRGRRQPAFRDVDDQDGGGNDMLKAGAAAPSRMQHLPGVARLRMVRGRKKPLASRAGGPARLIIAHVVNRQACPVSELCRVLS